MTRLFSLALLVVVFRVSYGIITRVKLTQDVELKAGAAKPVPFDQETYNREHCYHQDDKAIHINHKAKFHIEAHASFSNLPTDSNAEANISVMRNGETLELTSCRTNDVGMWNNVCTMSVETVLFADDKVFVGVSSTADTMVTSADTYMFLSEKYVY